MSDDDADRERVDVKASSIQRTWFPKLIELTKAPHPEIAERNPTKMFLAPISVVHVERGVVQWELSDGTKYPAQECTVVTTARSMAMVLESPEEVARRVNAAIREPS